MSKPQPKRCAGWSGNLIRSPKPLEPCKRWTFDESGLCSVHRPKKNGAIAEFFDKAKEKEFAERAVIDAAKAWRKAQDPDGPPMQFGEVGRAEVTLFDAIDKMNALTAPTTGDT